VQESEAGATGEAHIVDPARSGGATTPRSWDEQKRAEALPRRTADLGRGRGAALPLLTAAAHSERGISHFMTDKPCQPQVMALCGLNTGGRWRKYRGRQLNLHRHQHGERAHLPPDT